MITLISHFLMGTPIFYSGFKKSEKFYVQICCHVKGHIPSGLINSTTNTNLTSEDLKS